MYPQVKGDPRLGCNHTRREKGNLHIVRPQLYPHRERERVAPPPLEASVVPTGEGTEAAYTHKVQTSDVATEKGREAAYTQPHEKGEGLPIHSHNCIVVPTGEGRGRPTCNQNIICTHRTRERTQPKLSYIHWQRIGVAAYTHLNS